MLGTFSEVPAVLVGHMLPLHQAACAFTAAHLDHSSKQSALHATHQHRPSLSAVQQVAAHKHFVHCGLQRLADVWERPEASPGQVVPGPVYTANSEVQHAAGLEQRQLQQQCLGLLP